MYCATGYVLNHKSECAIFRTIRVKLNMCQKNLSLTCMHFSQNDEMKHARV